MERHKRAGRLFFALSLIIYGIFILAGPNLGHSAIGVFFPVFAAALCWGWKGGLIAGLCAFPANMLAAIATGIDWQFAMLNPIAVSGHIFFILQGLVIGWLQDMYVNRRKAELRLREQIQKNTADLERAQAAEQKLEAILEQSADGIYITENKKQTLIMVNRAFLEMVGMSREELIGQQPYAFIPEVGKTYRTSLGEEVTIEMEYYEKNYSILQKLFTEGLIKDWQYYVVNPGGELVPVEANVTNLLDQQGERIGAISVVRDVTSHKLNEYMLNRTNDFLNNVIENSADCIILSNETGRITHINRAGLDMLGYSLEEMLGKTAMDFFSIEEGRYETTAGDSIWLSAEKIQSSYTRMSEFFDKGTISNYASYLMHKDGRLVEVEHSITMLFDGQGKIVGSVGITRDRSMRCRMEREINRQAALLNQANRELESFAYSVSHDLRAPLRSISGFSAALEEDFTSELPAEAHDYLRRIQKASARMGSLIDDLLNLSRVSRYDMQRDTVDLSALAVKIVEQLREQAPERSVSCTIQPGLTATGDSHLLRIMLENLLGNAWKYTAKQGAAEIFFGLSDDGARPSVQDDKTTIFCVRDNGVGFDMAYADKLFIPFQRLHSEKDFPGTGIGLATVQRIVHRHGGKTWAHSNPETGTNFYFTL
jgi:PAS domain S-box-containing protein